MEPGDTLIVDSPTIDSALQDFSDRVYWPGEYKHNPQKAHEVFHTEDGVEETLDLLKEGEQHLVLDPQRNGAILIGMTGSGKSTAGLFMVGDPEKLIVTGIKNKAGRVIKCELEDLYNKTSSSLSKSKTLVPDLFVDEITAAPFYDFPGFADTRGAPEDVTANFLMKKVVDYVHQLKVVIVVKYQTIVTDTADRIHFPKLLDYIGTFLNDIDLFQDSITLLATRVPFEKIENDEGDEVDLTDAEQRDKIAEYLQKLLVDFREEAKSPKSDARKVYLQRAIRIMEVILKTNDVNDFPRIGLFHNPKKPLGPVKNNPRYMKEREVLRKMVFGSNLVDVQGNEFGFALSESTKLTINKIIPKIQNNFRDEIKVLATKLEEYYHARVKKTHDNLLTQEQLTIEHQILSKAVDSLEKTPNPALFLRKIIAALSEVQVRLPTQHYFALNTQVDYLIFFKKVSDNAVESTPFKWAEPLRSAVEVVNKYQQWFSFLVNLYKELSSYEIQLNKQSYNVANLEDWGQANKSQGIKITRSNYGKFLEVLRTKQRMVNLPLDVDPDRYSLLDGLNQVLDVTLVQSNDVQCVGDKELVARGSYLTVSDILSKKSLCRDLQAIKLFAYNTIFIDNDVNLKGEEIDLVLASPTWHIQRRTNIELSGVNGKDITSKAAMGKHPGEGGDDGTPGNPGTPSGNFLGLTKSVINSHNLNVYVNGGDGGRGQDGGNGMKGLDIPRPDTSTFPDLYDHYYYMIPEESMNNFLSKYRQYKGYDYEVTGRSECHWKGSCHSHFVLHPIEKGGAGGKGGDGGASGSAGKAGQAIYISVDSVSPKIHLTNENGWLLAGGNGGHGGYGGDNAQNFTIHAIVNQLDFWNYEAYSVLKSWKDLGRASSGHNGAKNANHNGRIAAKSPRSYRLGTDVNRYKKYLRERLDSPVEGTVAYQFLKELYNNELVNAKYDTLDFINELNLLEEQYSLADGRHDKINLELHYRSFMERTEAHSEKLKKMNANGTKEQRLVLMRLYTASLAKITAVNELDSTLVTDIAEFLGLLKAQIQNIADLEQDQLKTTATDKYVVSIQNKIDEAEEFTGGDVSKSIKETFNKVTDSVDDLVKTVHKLQNNTLTEANELTKKREELGQQLIIKRIMGSLSILGTVVGMLGPYGKAVEVGINSGSSIAEHFVIKDVGDPEKVTLPGGVDSLLSDAEKETEETLEAKEQSLQEQFDAILKHFEGTGEVFKGIKEDVKGMKAEFEKAKKAKEAKAKKVAELQEKLKKKIKKEEKRLYKIYGLRPPKEEESESEDEEDEKPKGKLEKLSEKAKTAFKAVKNIVTVGQVMYKEYITYKDDLNKLSVVADEVNAAYDKFQNLFHFETKIYNHVVPLLKTMRGKLTDMQNNFKGKSKAALNVEQWKVQDSLKDMKVEMVRIVKGFDVEEQIAINFDKIEQAMNILINLYGLIQDYEAEKALGQFISEVNGQRSSVLRVQDPQLKKALTELELTIRRNLIVHHYNLALTSVKLSVFPLVNQYLGTSAVSVKGDLKDVADRVKVKLDEYVTSYKQYKTIISGETDRYLFQQIYTPKLPLFEWDGTAYNSDITRLLSGQKIFLKADVSTMFDHNAVKVKMLELNFVSRNKTILAPTSIETALSPFKYSMLHSGFSNYRCDNKFYTITHPREDLVLSFQKKGQIPITRNEVYDKLASGDVFLSPYTYWTIELTNIANTSSTDFSALKHLIGKVNLQLIGQGKYVSPKLKVCGDELDEYFEQDNTIGDLVRGFNDEVKLENLVHDLKLKTFSSSPVLLAPSFTYNASFTNPELYDAVLSAPVACDILEGPVLEAPGSEEPGEEVLVPDTHEHHLQIDYVALALLNSTAREQFKQQYPESAHLLDDLLQYKQPIQAAETEPARKRRSPKMIWSEELYEKTPNGFVAFEDLGLSSSGHKSSSAINTVINLILLNLTFVRFTDYFVGLSGKLSSVYDRFFLDESRSESDSKPFTPNMDASTFFQTVDNCLILAPLFIHMWNKWFGQQRQAGGSGASSKVVREMRITEDGLLDVIGKVQAEYGIDGVGFDGEFVDVPDYIPFDSVEVGSVGSGKIVECIDRRNGGISPRLGCDVKLIN